MRILRIIPLFIFTIFIASCTDDGNKFTINADISGMPQQMVVLEELGINKHTVIDSTQSGDNGHFELSGTAPEPGLYRIRFMNDRQKIVLLSIDKGNLKISGDWNAIENYDVEGSKPSASLQGFMFTLRQLMNDFNTIGMVMDTLQAQGKDSLLMLAQQEAQGMNQNFTRYIEQYADTTQYLPNAIFAARMLNPATEKQFLNSFTQSLPARFPDNKKLVDEFTQDYNNILAMQNQQQQGNSAAAAGGKAPAISLPTPDGKTVTLESMKGKYVLVDFWASWCAPCRRENPNVVAAYNKYKGKNFTILGVSLDENKDKWQEAIAKDNLAWAHVSDLRGWESVAARDYGVESIPSNFLVDPEGNIIASNLRGEELESKLAEVLK